MFDDASSMRSRSKKTPQKLEKSIKLKSLKFTTKNDPINFLDNFPSKKTKDRKMWEALYLI
jgi:hypothetical protein